MMTESHYFKIYQPIFMVEEIGLTIHKIEHI